MNVLDLFSGIGGFSLGLERAGMRTVAFCEIDPYCRAVLNKHWPDVPVWGDIRTLTWANRNADNKNEHGCAQHDETGHRMPEPGGIDVICGGFPCQDISLAGKGAGLAGDRSGLWSEYARIIGEVRPRYVIVENVSALLGRGLERVIGDLAALGFDAEWHCIPASAVGAPHRRDRIWIVAYPNGSKWGAVSGSCIRMARKDPISQWQEGSGGSESGREDVAYAGKPDVEGQRLAIGIQKERGSFGGTSWWQSEPAMGELVDGISGGLVRFEGRVARGIPNRVHKLKALGNAVVPQIPEIIGRAIMSFTKCNVTKYETEISI